MPVFTEKVQIIPLGGLGEIGKNMYVVQYEDDIIVLDSGLMFPDEDMFGIDLVIPDFSYLLENRERVRAVFLTHGHEDHIGSLSYLLKQLKIPVYGTKLTLGLVGSRLKENGINDAVLNQIKPRDIVNIGPFSVEFIKMSHSIPDVVGFAIHTPAGLIVHTGDFKIDLTPVDSYVTDFQMLSKLGEIGVLVLLSDSTNAERPGYTMSEREVGQAFEQTFREATGRILVATFASNVHRLQQAVDVAFRYGRKVAVVGRSIVNVVEIASNLGYLTVPEGMFIDIEDIKNYPKNEILILTTGSQGEPMSALTRMAMADHRQVEILPEDTVIISALPIPGNEKLVARTVDHLFRLGARVVYESMSGVHVSGHANQEELKLIMNILKPKFFVPVHGEYRHLIHHAELAENVGIPRENIFVAENGSVLEFSPDSARVAGKVTAGKVLVDGLGVGDVGNIVLRDRRQLAQDGILIVVVTIEKERALIVAGPDVVSRGFVYVRESEEMMEEVRERIRTSVERALSDGSTEWSSMKNGIRDVVGKFLYERTRRRPMIMPIIVEV